MPCCSGSAEPSVWLWALGLCVGEGQRLRLRVKLHCTSLECGLRGWTPVLKPRSRLRRVGRSCFWVRQNVVLCAHVALQSSSGLASPRRAQMTTSDGMSRCNISSAAYWMSSVPHEWQQIGQCSSICSQRQFWNALRIHQPQSKFRQTQGVRLYECYSAPSNGFQRNEVLSATRFSAL